MDHKARGLVFAFSLTLFNLKSNSFFMSKLTTEFSFEGVYSRRTVFVKGFYHHIPKGAIYSPVINYGLLSIHFRIYPLSNEPSVPPINPPYHVFIFLGEKHNPIGELVDGQPQCYTDSFYKRMKLHIMAAYIDTLRKRLNEITH